MKLPSKKNEEIKPEEKIDVDEVDKAIEAEKAQEILGVN